MPSFAAPPIRISEMPKKKQIWNQDQFSQNFELRWTRWKSIKNADRAKERERESDSYVLLHLFADKFAFLFRPYSLCLFVIRSNFLFQNEAIFFLATLFLPAMRYCSDFFCFEQQFSFSKKFDVMNKGNRYILFRGFHKPNGTLNGH